jgi:hypothetical protein
VRGAALFDRWPAPAASAQAAVAGAYAWAATVVPPAWATGAPTLARVSAGAGLVALLSGAAGERRWGSRARFGSLWAFVLSSALTWSLSPSQLAPARVDAFGALSGMLGWGLFALASAGPALGGSLEAEGTVVDGTLEARKRLAKGDAAYVLGGLLLAVAFQIVGWSEANPERALLIRLVALAAGLAIVGAAAEIAFARQSARSIRPWRVRVRGSAAALTLLAMLVLAGLLLAMAR